LESSGIKKEKIKILSQQECIGPAPMKRKWRCMERRLSNNTPPEPRLRDNDLLESIGKTKRGTHVYVNRDFYFSDIKIATGLVESHFFYRDSGGRKAICPGLVDVKTIQNFTDQLS